MTMALQAWNLQKYSGGRMILGLGSQVRAHIENRFSMPWGAPAEKMREFVLALRAKGLIQGGPEEAGKTLERA